MISIVRCESESDFQQFEKTPEILHGSLPFFVPTYPGTIVKLFRSDSPFQKDGKITAFLAYRNDKLVGRIAAIINRKHNEYYSDSQGFFGFFDFINEPEVASTLLKAVKDALSSEGYSSLHGPFNPTINDECGLLVEGFDSIPMLMMPYHPPYYQDIYEMIGLKSSRNLYAFYISTKRQAPDRVLKICDRARTKLGLTLRPIDLNRLSSELEIIKHIYNQTLDRNSGFVPISLAELSYSANDLKKIMDPSLVLFAEKDGQPVGFSMSLPNINEFLWKGRSWPHYLRPVNLIWQMLTRRTKNVRVMILGVIPEYRKKGVAALLYAETLFTNGKKYRGGELSWIEENNKEIISGALAMGAEKYKTYRLYQTDLAPN